MLSFSKQFDRSIGDVVLKALQFSTLSKLLHVSRDCQSGISQRVNSVALAGCDTWIISRECGGITTTTARHTSSSHRRAAVNSRWPTSLASSRRLCCFPPKGTCRIDRRSILPDPLTADTAQTPPTALPSHKTPSPVSCRQLQCRDCTARSNYAATAMEKPAERTNLSAGTEAIKLYDAMLGKERIARYHLRDSARHFASVRNSRPVGREQPARVVTRHAVLK